MKNKFYTLGLAVVFGFILVMYLLNVNIKEDKDNYTVKSVDKYFPIQKGDFWMYGGIKREEKEDGNVETNQVQKRVEVLDIQDTADGKVVVLGGSEPAKYLIKDSTIDFNPDLPQESKFIWTFPLYVGQKFGSKENLRNRKDGFYIELVEEKLSKEILGKKYNECFRVTYKGGPDTSHKVFCYGLGIVEEGYKHNGTVLEWNYKLTSTNRI